jgi:hypothetical protein
MAAEVGEAAARDVPKSSSRNACIKPIFIVFKSSKFISNRNFKQLNERREQEVHSCRTSKQQMGYDQSFELLYINKHMSVGL